MLTDEPKVLVKVSDAGSEEDEVDPSFEQAARSNSEDKNAVRIVSIIRVPDCERWLIVPMIL